VSGRSAVALRLTRHWLESHQVPNNSLWLRPQGDTRDSATFKLDCIEKLRGQGFEPILFLEDLPSVSRSLSVTVPVLTVNPLYSDDASSLTEESVRS
jgi:hypothetical protein